MPKKVLVTGFDPFGGEQINPALEVLKQLNKQAFDGITIVTQEIPTAFKKSIHTLQKAIQCHQPDVVICIGQAGGRAHITPERIAINLDDARIPDNDGNQPIDTHIEKNGPTAYWTGLPVKRIARAIKHANIPASVSNTAGTFVCNHLFYGLMHLITQQELPIQGGFIHIPFIPEQAHNKQAPSLSLADITKAIEIAIYTAATYQSDIHTIEGAIH